jgi:hypothetical protein
MFLCWKGKTILETLIACRGNTSSSLDRNKKKGEIMNYWAGVLSGMCAGAIIFIVMMFVVIEQNNELKDKLEVEIAHLEEKVTEHDEIMNYFGWLKERDEKVK